MFLGIYSAPLRSGGTLILDATWRASDVQFSTNRQGYESLSAFVRLPFQDAFQLFDRTSVPHVVYVDTYANTPFEGRLEDVSIEQNGVSITAYGYVRALRDVPYIAMWSKTTIDDWRPLTSTNVTGSAPDRYEFRTDEYLYIAPRKNSVQGNTPIFGLLGFSLTNGDTRNIVGASFDYTFVTTAANWRAAFQSRQRDYTGIANDWIITSAGAGTLTGSVNIAGMSANAFVVNFFMDFNAAPAAYTGETGDAYLRITNLRLVTATTNRINTTLSANRNAGTSVTATVGSTARMYVGQRLQIGGTISESVVVESITSSTQFVATFAQNHVSTNTVQAHVIYPDEIMSALATFTSGVNSTQLSSTLTNIQSQAIDLMDESYRAEYPFDIISRLVLLGDNQTTPRRWEFGVKNDQALYARYEGYLTQTWYVDATDIHIEKTLDTLYNSVFAVYDPADKRSIYTNSNTDATSVSRHGITRRLSISASTSSLTQANIQRDMVLNDKKDPPPKATISFRAIYDIQGVRQPLWLPCAGDTIVIRNVPPDTSTTIDRIRSFRIQSTEYNEESRTLRVEPEGGFDSLAFLLARKDKGIR